MPRPPEQHTIANHPPPPPHSDDVVFNFADAISFVWIFFIGLIMWWVKYTIQKRDKEQETRDKEYHEFKQKVYDFMKKTEIDEARRAGHRDAGDPN